MKNIIAKVYVNEFVRRQIKGSGKTYAADLSFQKIASHAEFQLRRGHYTQGYRDGVILAHVSKELIHHFICPFVKITPKTKLKADVVKRRDEEEPYIRIRALNGKPLNTVAVDLILYHHKVLLETNEENSMEGWELISFHAIPKGINKMPMGPITMMRNQLQRPGGTKASYNSDEWAESIQFWQNYAVLDKTL